MDNHEEKPVILVGPLKQYLFFDFSLSQSPEVGDLDGNADPGLIYPCFLIWDLSLLEGNTPTLINMALVIRVNIRIRSFPAIPLSF